MNTTHKRLIWSILILLFIAEFSLAEVDEIRIIDAKTASDVSPKFMPVKPADTFREGTSKVFCWFKWKDAKVGTKLTARWHYVTDGVHILDNTFAIPRKEGSGGISLSMPASKTLPSGSYRVDLAVGDHTLKSVEFKVE